MGNDGNKVHILFIIVIISLLLNTLYLDILVLTNKNSQTPKNTNIFDTKNSTSTIQETDLSSAVYQVCPNSCISYINEATSSIKLMEPSSTPKPTTPPQSTTSTTSTTTTSSSIKEIFIPFGNGSTSAEDWVDLAGVSSYVDSNAYGKIKNVTFEASVRIPTGNQIAYVRLYNTTDKHPVWFSEVSLEGGTAQLLISKSITLDQGNKLYQVQMKTSLKYTAILDQARLHVTLQ